VPNRYLVRTAPMTRPRPIDVRIRSSMIAFGTNGTPIEVLLVEDHLGDVRLIEESFRDSKRAIHLHVAYDGVEAMEFLTRDGPYADAPRPDIILLDLNLPRMDGREVLARIKDDVDLKGIPTVVLTTSDAEIDVAKAYDLNASFYISKPVGLEAFESVMRGFNDFWLTKIKLPKISVMKILLIEDNPGDAGLLRAMLAGEGSRSAELIHVTSMAEAESRLADHGVDVVLLDPGLPDSQGLQSIRRARAVAPLLPLVVLTGFDDDTMAARALQEGAQDFLIKGRIEARALLLALRYAIERKTMEDTLFGEKERAQVTLNSIGDAVACTDSTGNITFLNIVAERLSGWSRQEAVGRPMATVLRILDAKSHETIPNPMELAIQRNRTEHLPLNCVLLRRDGKEIPIEDSVSPIHDREGRVSGAVIVFRDATASRALELEKAYSAEHDFLSGLPNRRLLKERTDFAIALARRHMKKLAVLFLDLDGFKHVNDSLGHSIGDKLLQSVAGRLANCVRGTDTVSRMGGDEFVVLLSEVEQAEDAAITAARMLETVAAAHSVDGHSIHVTTSIGVSIYPDDGLDAETLIKCADTAMYQAKENGRQSYQFFETTMNVRAVERQLIEQGLRCAVEKKQFELHYQPKIDLRTGKIAGAEALIRWTHPDRGLISPDKFIPVAEACGLIIPIGAWVLREACAQTRRWAEAGLPALTIAVNVSAREFQSMNFPESLFATLNEIGLDPRSLVIELTESVLVKQADSAASILHTLRGRGVHVSIDDFGTGYSSLSYLQKFPVDSLKIDQAFVRQISKPTENKHIVTAIISMARSLKLRVVAEGVETLEELTFLRAHQCDEAQGYYFSRPVPADEFAELLRVGIKVPFSIFAA
jgi:diguanylate cyclase (GGDEF)-like protein/PAS domain S-box-containing protein